MSKTRQSRFTSQMRELGLEQTPEFFEAWRQVSSCPPHPEPDYYIDPLDPILKEYSKRVIARSDPSKKRMLVLGGSNRPTRPPRRYESHFYYRDPNIYVDAQTFDQTFIINEYSGKASLSVPEIIVKIGQRDYPIKGLSADFNDIQTWRMFPDNFFDLIVFDLSTVWYLRPTNELLLQIVRTLKPRGYFYIPSIEDSTHWRDIEITESLKRIQKEQSDKILFERSIKGMPFYRDTPGVRGRSDSVVEYCNNDMYLRLSKNNFVNRFIKHAREKMTEWKWTGRAPPTRDQVHRLSNQGKYEIAHFKSKGLPQRPRETIEKILFEVDTRLTRQALTSAFTQKIREFQEQQYDQMKKGSQDGINESLRRYDSDGRKKYIRLLKQRLDQIQRQERQEKQVI